VYLKPGQYKVLPQNETHFLGNLLLKCKDAVLHSLRTFIKGPKELGLAEALLIGYKDDLDKSLVQSYSNTGVVHIIAISGLHLGLIYLLLVGFTKPLASARGLSWLRFIIIVSSLWGFSIIVGAQPSVLRSAVMFSCLALGDLMGRKSSVYNSLALSAFILLCINPFWLWDVGFQLSYTAVLSIVIFFRPVYNAFYIQNKGLDAFWKLNAVTLAAQVLTLPIILFHFHQFPLLFLIANMVAVPLSSAILIGELILLSLSFLPFLAHRVGAILEGMIRFMNGYVEHLDSLPFAVWNGFSLSLMQVILLYGFIAGTAYWLFEKRKSTLWYALACLLLFTGLRSYSLIISNRQKKLIVYNVPGHQAIDVIEGRYFSFIGDTGMVRNQQLRNFHLQPARLEHRVRFKERMPVRNFTLHNKQVLIIDSAITLHPDTKRPIVDVLILSKNPKVYMNDICEAFAVKKVVMDGSVPAWKKKLWTKDCALLKLPYHDVEESGAFVMKLQ
jgi:competence protein ComEC